MSLIDSFSFFTRCRSTVAFRARATLFSVCAQCSEPKFHREMTNSIRPLYRKTIGYSVSSYLSIVCTFELFIVWQLDGETISKVCGLYYAAILGWVLS